MLSLILISQVSASGTNEEGYIKIGSSSDDMQAVIKAHSLIIKNINQNLESFFGEADEYYNYYTAQFTQESQRISNMNPELWETDAQLEERKAIELEQLSDIINKEYQLKINDLAEPYQNELDVLYEQLEINEVNLMEPKFIDISPGEDIEYDTYLRNERLWPIKLHISNRLIPETSITVVADFLASNHKEEEVRKSIIEFDKARRNATLSARVGWHIVPDYTYSDYSTTTAIQYLIVVDSIHLLQDGEILYARMLDTPMILHGFMVDEDLNLEPIKMDDSYSSTNNTYTTKENIEYNLRSKNAPVLLTDSSGYISQNEEENRLVGNIPTALMTPSTEKIVFRISNGAEPESLDPALIQGVPEHRIFEALFEGLVANDPETALAVPGVAESWEANEDGTQYTFKLREDAVWSDGVPITANDVVYSWLRLLDPMTAGPYAWFPCMFLEGATEFNAGEAGPEAVGIRALDDHTFQMDLIGPLPYAVDALTHYSFSIVPKHAIEEFGDKWTSPENFVGNGPFVLTERIPQTSLTVAKSDTYWDKENVKLDKVIFYSPDSTTTNYNMYLNGEIDWATNVPNDQLSAAQMRSDFQSSPQLSTYYYVFQNEVAPFDNPDVRRALSLALDREALVEGVTRAGEIPAWGIVPPMAGYEALEFPYDNMDDMIAEAQDLLARAGYPNGAGFPTFTILYNTDEGHKQIAEFVQQEWKDNLGINVTLENQEWQTYLSNRNEGNFEVARAGWVGDYQDPNTFLDMFITGTGMNGGNYSNEVYDLLINEAARMPAGEDRFGVLKIAEDIMINQDMGIMPFYYYVAINMIDTDKWGGWHPNTMDYHPVKDIYSK
jgi:oligopeptide transport system substrate-binding protein